MYLMAKIQNTNWFMLMTSPTVVNRESHNSTYVIGISMLMRQSFEAIYLEICGVLLHTNGLERNMLAANCLETRQNTVRVNLIPQTLDIDFINYTFFVMMKPSSLSL